MKPKRIKKIFKIFGLILLVVFSVLLIVLINFISPKTDREVMSRFKEAEVQPHLSYEYFKGREVRLIKMQKKLDTLLPTLVFVHGSPGSSMDFQRYLKDSVLNNLANIIAYDRVGYGTSNTGKVLESLEEEVNLLHQLLKDLNTSKVILIGYSYGGTLVMASEKKFKKKVILAASVRGDLEPMFWMMNFYKWRFTRPFVPKVLRGASIEKLRHVTELPNYKNNWNLSPSSVLSIHGKEDMIVPYQNSLFLEQVLGAKKFSLIPIEEGNHSLIWSNFDIIRTALLNSIRE